MFVGKTTRVVQANGSSYCDSLRLSTSCYGYEDASHVHVGNPYASESRQCTWAFIVVAACAETHLFDALTVTVSCAAHQSFCLCTPPSVS